MAIPSTASFQTPFPDSVGKYELLLPIGTGGMATVYLARSTGAGGFEREVALKLVHAHLRADEDSKAQLLEEAKLAARIRHPNVVPVSEVDEDPFGIFLVMDYVEGDTLSGLARATKNSVRKLSRPLMARILNDALLGLHAAHELTNSTGAPVNLVHRDFSPQNILLSIQGITRLGDFGVAKSADRVVRTKTGLIKGKISYMSPEQARGHDVDRRCDVWAAGVVAWELIAGRRLHDAEDDVSTLLSIVTGHPPRLSEVCDDIPKALDEALAWALTPDVERRCPTAETFRQRLEAAWNTADGIATTQELAEFVTAVTREKLAERAKSVKEVQGLRQRMGQLSWTQIEETSGSISASSATNASHSPGGRVSSRPPASSRPPVSEADEEVTRTTSLHVPAGSAGRIGPEEATATSAVVPAFAAPSSSSRWAWLSLAALMAIGGGVFALRGSKGEAISAHTDSDSLPVTAGASTSSSEPFAAVPRPLPAQALSGPTSTALSPSATATEPVPAPRPPPRAAKPRRKHVAPAEETKATAERRMPAKPGLATSPYGKPKFSQ